MIEQNHYINTETVPVPSQIEEPKSLKNPFRLVINTFIFLMIFLLVIYFGFKAFQVFGPEPYKSSLAELLNDFKGFSLLAWQFARPLIQLVIILAIVDWLLKRLGISLFNKQTKFEWNVQTIIAIIVISAFSIAALGSSDISALKDLALVVVGFYFGTQKKADGNIKNGNTTAVVPSNTPGLLSSTSAVEDEDKSIK